MRDISVVSAPLSRNEVASLANFFEASFSYFCTPSVRLPTVFVEELQTIAGLGFTACLTKAGHLTLYQIYLDRFIRYDRGDFTQHPDPQSLNALSKAIAEMIHLALDTFCKLNYPRYYKSFIKSLINVIRKLNIEAVNKGEEAEKILTLLRQQQKPVA